MVKFVSVTDLTAYSWCPRSVYIRKVLGLKEPTKPIMLLGSIRHKVFEDANKKEQHLVSQVGKDMNPTDVLNLFSTSYSQVLNMSVYHYSGELDKLNMSKETVTEEMKSAVLTQATNRAHEILQFATKHDAWGAQLWDALTPKVIAELSISSESLRLRGIIDRILDYGDEYVVSEIKTGRVPREGVWPDHQLQLAAYWMMLREKSKHTIKEGLVHYTKEDVTRQVVFNPFMEHEVTSAVEKVHTLLEGALPEYCGRQSCGVCSLGENFENHLEAYSRKV